MPLFLNSGTYTVAGDVRSPPPLLLSLLLCCCCGAALVLVWCACGGFDGGVGVPVVVSMVMVLLLSRLCVRTKLSLAHKRGVLSYVCL